MSGSVRPHRWQPTGLPCPWDSPGKNTGVGCQFLLQCMKVKSESDVAQSCSTLSDPMDCSLPGSSTHGIFQARAKRLKESKWFREVLSTLTRIHLLHSKPHPAIQPSPHDTSFTIKRRRRMLRIPQTHPEVLRIHVQLITVQLTQ